jgi:hypothetical protein
MDLSQRTNSNSVSLISYRTCSEFQRDLVDFWWLPDRNTKGIHAAEVHVDPLLI